MKKANKILKLYDKIVDKAINYKNSSMLFYWISFIVLYLYIGIKIIWPFLKYNNLLTWDMAGLYSSAWYMKEYLFPRIVGWNPFFFLGYPQNQFYPPFYSYMSALLSQFMALDLAFKLLLVITIVLTPLSFYYFARSFNISKNKSIVIMYAMFSLLFFFPHDHYGGNMHSTFRVGLVANAIGLMLFFFYFGSLERGFKKKTYVISSVLFSLIILNHVMAAMTASIALIGFTLSKIKSKENIILLIKHGFLTFLLTAFWTLPFLAKFGWTSALKMVHPPQVITLALTLSIVYALFVIFRKYRNMLPVGMFLLLLTLFCYFVARSNLLPIHLYRFNMFIILMIPIALLSLLKHDKLILFTAFILASLLFIFIAPSIEPEGNSDIENISYLPEDIDGRVLVVASFNKQPSVHVLQHRIPMENNAHGVKGLYVESSVHGRYVFDIEKEIDKYTAIHWGVYVDEWYIPQEDTKVDELLPYQLDIFNINYLVSFYKKLESWKVVKNVTQVNGWQFYLYDVGNSSLIEVLDYRPQVLMTEQWGLETTMWFLSDWIKEGVIVNENVPGYVGNSSNTVEILEMSPTQEYIKFKVNATEPVPVLIKISAFPNWKAYQNGEELKIYLASPYLMLVYGYGEIELKYEMLFVDKISCAISIIGIIALALLIYFEIKKNKRGKK